MEEDTVADSAVI